MSKIQNEFIDIVDKDNIFFSSYSNSTIGGNASSSPTVTQCGECSSGYYYCGETTHYGNTYNVCSSVENDCYYGYCSDVLCINR